MSLDRERGIAFAKNDGAFEIVRALVYPPGRLLEAAEQAAQETDERLPFQAVLQVENAEARR